MMTLEDIYKNLCTKDARSPYYNDCFYDDGEERPEARNGCFCDPCYGGRDTLALEILRLKQIRDRITNETT